MAKKQIEEDEFQQVLRGAYGYMSEMQDMTSSDIRYAIGWNLGRILDAVSSDS